MPAPDRLATREADERQTAAARRHDGHGRAAQVRERTLPGRVLHHHRHESHRRSSARSQSSSSSGTRKSDTRKTNVPGGSDGRRSKRWRNDRVTVSCGAPNGRRASEPPLLVLAPRGPPERLALGEVEVAAEAARGDRRVRDQERRRPHRLGLRQPGQRRREERHLRPAVGEDHDARRLVGEALADDELVARARRRQPGGGGPVDRVHVVPGRYGREPAMSEPVPRRALRIAAE